VTIANNMQTYHSVSGPNSSVHQYCLHDCLDKEIKRSYRLQPFRMPILHVMQRIYALLTVVLNSYLSVKTKSQTIVIAEENVL